ncbi:aminopeptidase P family N-terminal domain-containing protein, partial [Aminomonas paucivorans]
MLQQQRVARLRRRLEEEGLDGVFLGPSSDLEYLSGLVLF